MYCTDFLRSPVHPRRSCEVDGSREGTERRSQSEDTDPRFSAAQAFRIITCGHRYGIETGVVQMVRSPDAKFYQNVHPDSHSPTRLTDGCLRRSINALLQLTLVLYTVEMAA